LQAGKLATMDSLKYRQLARRRRASKAQDKGHGNPPKRLLPKRLRLNF
jgi:hypothetical protein